MSRRRAISIAAVLGLAALLAFNTLLTDAETKKAEVTVPGGELVSLPTGVLQVTDQGPRRGSPIILLHCFTCAIDWWDGTIPLLAKHHRVIAIDLLGHGGSEKPTSGYGIEEQAKLVAAALSKLGVRHATVVGHSLGGIVATALTEASPQLVRRVVIIDQAPVNDGFGADLPLSDALTFTPVIGEFIWRVMPDSAIKDGLSIAFAPGYDVPDRFVDDFRRLNYSVYDSSPTAEDAYTHSAPLDKRLRQAEIPLLAIFGADEQIYDPRAALRAYARLPRARTRLIRGAGHSPNVERPAATARLILDFIEHQGLADRPESKRATQAGGPDKQKPAATYSPRGLPPKYHRR